MYIAEQALREGEQAGRYELLSDSRFTDSRRSNVDRNITLHIVPMASATRNSRGRTRAASELAQAGASLDTDQTSSTADRVESLDLGRR